MKTEAQIKAQKNWEAKNREKSNYLKYKYSAKTFIKKADLADRKEFLNEIIKSIDNKEDLQELQGLINDRLQEL